MNKWLAIVIVAFIAWLAVASWSESKYEAKMVESCVSAGGEWVDVNDSWVVNMGCKR